MFTSLKSWFSDNWKKLLMSVGAFVISFLLLKFVLAPLFSLTVACVLASLGVAYIIFTKVALWEVQRLVNKAKEVIQ